MSLHVNWDEIPLQFKYVAQDKSGEVYAYTVRPFIGVGDSTWSFRDGHTFFYAAQLAPTTVDWDEVIIERPKSTTSNNCSGHPHANLMLEFAKDAAKNAEPWKLWEGRHIDGGNWSGLGPWSGWAVDCEYRRKQRKVVVEISEDLAIKFIGVGGTKSAEDDWNTISAVQDLVQKELDKL